MSNIKLKKLSIAKNSSIFYDTIVLDRKTGKFIFGSFVENDKLLKANQLDINRKSSIYVQTFRSYYSTDGKYDTEKKKSSNSDFGHLVINKRDNIEYVNDDEILECFIYIKDNNEICNKLFDKLYSNTSIPLLERWMPYISERLFADNRLMELTVDTIYEKKPFECLKLMVSKKQLLDIVQTGIKEKHIFINESYENSDLMNFTDGLDSYLNIFGEIFAEKIQKSFHPKFNPKTDEYTDWVNYYDDSCFHNGIELYGAQKATIQASVNNLNKNNVTFLIGEMGVGKTALGAGIAYAHYEKKTGMTNIVMCPSHLIEKWKREIEKLVPNSKAYIIENIEDLIKIERKIKSKYKSEHTFLIISKEAAKFSYEKRPSGIWSEHLHTFICPECGQVITKKVKQGEGRYARYVDMNFDELDFQKPYSYNEHCKNIIRKFDKKTSTYVSKICNCSLWVPFNKEDKTNKWIKLGKEGWIYNNHIDKIINNLEEKEFLTKKDAELYSKILEAKNILDSGEKLKGAKAPRKYSIAKYIRERFKGYIDYFLADELHLYKSDSKQGQAMADISNASKHFIGLTGTLLNGYADGLFYILYRTLPQLMKKEGYEYSNEIKFMKDYGVIRKTNNYSYSNGSIGARVGLEKEKRLPGVSPIVFTKFLLENSVFLSLSDMDGGLPKYEEIPISVPMDEELRNAYEALERDLREACSFRANNGGVKMMGSLLQTLSVYPDMPYDQPEVLHPDTNEIMVYPPSLSKGLRNKEKELLNLIKEKVDNGEKVLVYYEWTNKTDIAEKITNMLKEENIRSVVLTSSVKASEREEWIDKQIKKGIDVLICNPKLVETGLDLLDFTNIVFYQIGYNIFTMRQASRRSWRLSQTKDIKVYFLYYEGTIQAQALSLMATKLQASMAIEGKFSEEGLRAMSNNEDLLTQIANSVVEGIKDTVQVQTFVSVNQKERSHDLSRNRSSLEQLLIKLPKDYNLKYLNRYLNEKNKVSSNKKTLSNLLNFKSSLGNILLG